MMAILSPPAGGSDSSCRIPVVSGMGGVGKTALAVHAAHAVRSQFPDGQLYADLGGTSTRHTEPAEVLLGFLRGLKVSESAIPTGLHERSQLFRTCVAGQRMLIVLDNVASDAQVRPLIPGGSGCRVVVTKRTRLTTLEGAALIDLDVLEPEKGLALLIKIIGPDRVGADPVAARRMVDLCGRLPLGLRIAGARLAARPHWALARLVHQLEDRQRRLDELRLGGMDLRESLRCSYRRVSTQAQTALRRLAWLTVPDFPAWTVAAVLHEPLTTGEEVAEMLVDARLLNVVQSDSAGRPRYSFHELVRLFAQAEPDE